MTFEDTTLRLPHLGQTVALCEEALAAKTLAFTFSDRALCEAFGLAEPQKREGKRKALESHQLDELAAMLCGERPVPVCGLETLIGTFGLKEEGLDISFFSMDPARISNTLVDIRHTIENRHLESRPIRLLGAMIDHLAGILGGELNDKAFVAKHAAHEIGVDQAGYSKMRKGNKKVSNDHLSRMVQLYRLGRYGLDYRLFHAPDMDTFRAILRARNVGTDGLHPVTRYLRDLADMADERSPIMITPINVVRRPDTSVGGIGAEITDTRNVTLRNGHRVTVQVKVPPELGEGYMVVINAAPEMLRSSILMPSEYAPGMKVAAGGTKMPSSPGLDAFPVNNLTETRSLGDGLDELRRTERRQVFAIWSSKPLEDCLETGHNYDLGVSELLDSQMRRLVERARSGLAEDPSSIHVSMREYRILAD